MNPSDTNARVAARDHAIRYWMLSVQGRNLAARIPDWRTRLAPDGAPILSAEVAGPGAAHALHQFASQAHLGLRPDDLRPVFDYDTPGRVACVWRYGGVWVELWHPDTVTGLPPVHAVPSCPPKSLPDRASGRLPYTRRRIVPKETTMGGQA